MSRFSTNPSGFCLGITVFFSAMLFFLPGVQFSFGQHSAQRNVDEEETRADLPFRVYAQWAIDNYDKNADGSLSKAEMKNMQSPLLEDRYDENNNGKLSFNEIVNAIRKPSSDQVQEVPKPKRNSEKLSINAKLVRYAQSLIRLYDVDKDNYLSQDEVEKMRRPVPLSSDSNGDGKFSLHEISQGLAKGITTNEVAKSEARKPVVVVKGNLDLGSERMVKLFVEQSMGTNDRNGDGVLDSNEIARAKWSTIRWQDSDTNNDGILTRDELNARYQEMFKQLLANTLDSNKSSNSDSAAKHQAEEARSMMTILSQIQEPPETNAGHGDLLGGLLGSGQAAGGLIGNAIGTTTKRPGSRKKESSAPALVNVEIYLLRLPSNSTADQLQNAVKTLNESDESAGDAAKDVAKLLGVTTYDQLVISAVDGRTANVKSGASVPRIEGTTETARGRVFRKSFVDVGLNASVVPKFNDQGILLSLEIAKSDLIDNGSDENDVPNDMLVNWTYDSSVLIESGERVVVGSSSSGQHWILIAYAYLVD